MRAAATLALVLLTGCGLMQQSGSSWPAGKIPIWPDQRGPFPLRTEELDNFRCVEGVLICENPTGTRFGTSYCRCGSSVSF